jgi:RNA:NAD 2'-phosphotransferase (TPT1/KptA family)
MVTLVIDANVCRDFRGIHTYTMAAKVSLSSSPPPLCVTFFANVPFGSKLIAFWRVYT